MKTTYGRSKPIKVQPNGPRSLKPKKSKSDPVSLVLKLLDAHERLMATTDPIANFGVGEEAKELYRHAYKHGTRDTIMQLRRALEEK